MCHPLSPPITLSRTLTADLEAIRVRVYAYVNLSLCVSVLVCICAGVYVWICVCMRMGVCVCVCVYAGIRMMHGTSGYFIGKQGEGLEPTNNTLSSYRNP